MPVKYGGAHKALAESVSDAYGDDSRVTIRSFADKMQKLMHDGSDARPEAIRAGFNSVFTFF